MDTTVHGGLDERSKVLVLSRSFSGDFVEPSSIGSVSHRLILQIAFSSLIADCRIVNPSVRRFIVVALFEFANRENEGE